MESNFNNFVIEYNNSNNNNMNEMNVIHNKLIGQFDVRYDFFNCGKCGANFGSIERFVFHKLSEHLIDIYYEDLYINGNFVKIPKLSQNDIKHDTKHDTIHNNCDQNKSTKNEKSNEVMTENVQKLITNGQTGREEDKQRSEEVSKAMPISLVINGQNNKKIFNCNDCKKMFTQKSRAVRHLESVHNWRFDSLKLINKSFNYNIDNNESESSVPESMRRMSCDKCGAHVKGKRALKVHQLTHTEERTFSCPYDGCSFMFKTKGSMQRHVRRHTNERPFKCELCGRTFRESGALTRHLKSRYVCINKSDSDLPNYGKARALPVIDSIIIKK